MVEKQTIRNFKIENDKAIAVKIDVYPNGKGHEVKEIMEETLDYQDICETVLDYVPRAIDKRVQKVLDKVKEIADLKAEIGDALESEEYKAYIEFMKDPGFARCDALFKKDAALHAGNIQLEGLKDALKQVEDIQEQFTNFKEFYEKHCEEKGIPLPEYVPPARCSECDKELKNVEKIYGYEPSDGKQFCSEKCRDKYADEGPKLENKSGTHTTSDSGSN